jgi:hypothetical protein
LVERLVRNEEVSGSIPLGSTSFPNEIWWLWHRLGYPFLKGIAAPRFILVAASNTWNFSELSHVRTP